MMTESERLVSPVCTTLFCLGTTKDLTESKVEELKTEEENPS